MFNARRTQTLQQLCLDESVGNQQQRVAQACITTPSNFSDSLDRSNNFRRKSCPPVPSRSRHTTQLPQQETWKSVAPFTERRDKNSKAPFSGQYCHYFLVILSNVSGRCSTSLSAQCDAINKTQRVVATASRRTSFSTTGDTKSPSSSQLVRRGPWPPCPAAFHLGVAFEDRRYPRCVEN